MSSLTLDCPDCDEEESYTFELYREEDHRGPYLSANLIVLPAPKCECPLNVHRILKLKDAAVMKVEELDRDRRYEARAGRYA